MATEDIMKMLEFKQNYSKDDIPEFTDLHDPIILNGCDRKFLFPYPTVLPKIWPCKLNEYNKEEFIKNFLGSRGNSVGGLLTDITEIPGVFIAGGAIAHLFNANHVKNDYDIFLYGGNFEDNVCKIVHLIRSYYSSLGETFFSIKPGLIEMRNGVNVFQIVLRKYTTRAHILHSFDLGASQVGFDGDDFYITSLGIYAYKYSINIAYKIINSYRFNKYVNYGFGVMFPFLNKEHKHPYFLSNKQINNISDAFFIKQLTQQYYDIILPTHETNHDFAYRANQKYIKPEIAVVNIIKSGYDRDDYHETLTKFIYFGRNHAQVPDNDTLMSMLNPATNASIFYSKEYLITLIKQKSALGSGHPGFIDESDRYKHYMHTLKKFLSKEEFIKFHEDFYTDIHYKDTYFEQFYETIVQPRIVDFIRQFIPNEEVQEMFVTDVFEEDYSIDAIASTYKTHFVPNQELNDPILVIKMVYDDDDEDPYPDAEEVCGICRMGIVSSDANTCRLACHKTHIFHMFATPHCYGITSWMAKKSPPTCPLCCQEQVVANNRIVIANP